MKKMSLINAAAVFVLSTSVWAETVFDGTWKTDVASIDFSAKPSIYVFKDGMFECKSCVFKTAIKANGSDQKIDGDPAADTLSVKAIDASHVEMISKKGGKIVARHKYAVSTDKNSMLHEYAVNAASNAEVVKGTNSYARVAYDKTGSNQMSGSWKAIKADKRSDNGLLLTYKSAGAMLSMSMPTGEGYTAKTDGSDTPFKGDPARATVAVKIRKNSLEETYKRDGKAVGMTRIEVDASGKKAKVDWIDNVSRTNGSYVMAKL